MALDLKAEFTRPLALLLAALAALGWVLFMLSSWSVTSVRKAQRLRIVELSEQSEKLQAELTRQNETIGGLADLQTKLAAAREDLTRVSQTRSDVQSDLLTAQKSLTNTRRDLTEADRTLQAQSSRLADIRSSTETAEASASDAAPQTTRVSRRGGRRAYRRGRQSRSYLVNRSR